MARLMDCVIVYFIFFCDDVWLASLRENKSFQPALPSVQCLAVCACVFGQWGPDLAKGTVGSFLDEAYTLAVQ